MKSFTLLLLSLLLLTACGMDDEYYVGLSPLDHEKEIFFRSHPLRERHSDARLKILAIGNSFTNNSTIYLPWMANTINSDSICIAKLCMDGASLNNHWSNHRKKSSTYTLHYSEGGKWILTDIRTIDDALMILDWDIIVIQQASFLSGDYSLFQPALDFLVALFHESNSKVKIAFNYTWAYFPWATHKYFDKFKKNPDLMYDAIMKSCNRASENLDLRILSATLVKDMRQEFADEENLFSTDGQYISHPLPQYALSSLWYESIVAPFLRTTSLSITNNPEDLDSTKINKVYSIIENILITSK